MKNNFLRVPPFKNGNSYINIKNKKEKKSLTSIANNGRSTRGYYRTCSRSFPNSAYPCWLGSGSARCKAPCLRAISPIGPSCRSDSIVSPRNSVTRNVHLR